MLTAVAPGQLVRYRNQVRDHLSGPIGVTPVDTLDKRVISGWIQEIQRKGLSAKTIKNVHGLLSAAMKTALILGYREDNPCRGVPSPKSTATAVQQPVRSGGLFPRLVVTQRAGHHGAFSVCRSVPAPADPCVRRRARRSHQQASRIGRWLQRGCGVIIGSLELSWSGHGVVGARDHGLFADPGPRR